MEEDSGAFKTNPRNQAQYGPFVMAVIARNDSSRRLQSRLFGTQNERAGRNFARNRSGRFAVFWIQLIRGGEGG